MRPSRCSSRGNAVLLAVILGGGAVDAQEDSPARPQETGLLEQTERRLVQLDVTVRGHNDAIDSLTAEDFELEVGGSEIVDLLVDRVCNRGAERGPTIPVIFVFYFDQPLLARLPGGKWGLGLAEKLIPQLVTGDNRGMVLSNGRSLTTFADLTADAGKLVAALDRIKEDPAQWDPLPQEPIRHRQPQGLQRLGLILARLANLDPPKVVLYFADDGSEWPPSAADQFIADANAQGVRLYHIATRGATSVFPDQKVGRGRQVAHRLVAPFEGRSLEADSDRSLARPTGGRTFSSTTSPPYIARQIQMDFECFYLLSFDPAGLPEDKRLPVSLHIKKRVEARARTSLVVQSRSSRLTAQLLGAFAAPDSIRASVPVRLSLIPTDYREGSYRALVQVAVDGSPLRGAVWDLGASLVSRDRVRHDFSRRVLPGAPGTPVVLEEELTFGPGAYELIAVAHETNHDQPTYNVIAAGRIEGSWPDPRGGPSVAGPIALVQPSAAAVVRGENVRFEASLGRTEEQAVALERPTALFGLVCRGREKAALRVTRSLVGQEAVSFPDVSLAPEENCLQLRDLIPARAMSEGDYRYEIRVSRGDQELSGAVREFHAAPAAPPTPSSQ